MIYAKTTQDGIESGAFAELWPTTSASDQHGFAASEGFAHVLPSRPHDPAVQGLEPCAVYEEDGVFYAVRVVSLPLKTIQTIVTGLVQKRLDDFAMTRGYDGILSACTYASSSIGRFQAEGQTAVDARDATWAACYQVLGEIQAGARPMPTMDELLAELPALDWPEA